MPNITKSAKFETLPAAVDKNESKEVFLRKRNRVLAVDCKD